MKFTISALFAVASASYGGYQTYPAEDDYGLSRAGSWDAPISDDYNNYEGVTPPPKTKTIDEYAVADDYGYDEEPYTYEQAKQDYGIDDMGFDVDNGYYKQLLDVRGGYDTGYTDEYGYDDGSVDYEGEDYGWDDSVYMDGEPW